MAGYLFNFSDFESLEKCIKCGFYSPIMSKNWSAAAAATLGDFVTMKPGDNVYFFSKRMVYGIGEIIEIKPEVIVADNFPGATLPLPTQSKTRDKQNSIMGIINNTKLPADKVQRWVIAFKPSPDFFKCGVDMDDLLSSSPHAFRSLRVFWKRTFIKIDDEENFAFKSAIIRKNLDSKKRREVFCCNFDKSKHKLETKSAQIIKPEIQELVVSKRGKNGALSAEMVLEVALLHQLASSEKSATEVFGAWDYLAHQVAASPMKAVDYMNRIDIFGYSWIDGYCDKIIEKYMVCELKKGKLEEEDISQVMKYVDWVCDEYANGDYSMIDAFLVGSGIKINDIEGASDVILRHYITGRNPLVNHPWRQLTLVSYNAEKTGIVTFKPEYDYSCEHLD